MRRPDTGGRLAARVGPTAPTRAAQPYALTVGQMKNKKSIPTLAILVRGTTLNGDSRWGAVEALGKLARKRFDKQPDAIAAATDWLDKNGY
jgi:hypothetical protein